MPCRWGRTRSPRGSRGEAADQRFADRTSEPDAAAIRRAPARRDAPRPALGARRTPTPTASSCGCCVRTPTRFVWSERATRSTPRQGAPCGLFTGVWPVRPPTTGSKCATASASAVTSTTVPVAADGREIDLHLIVEGRHERLLEDVLGGANVQQAGDRCGGPSPAQARGVGSTGRGGVRITGTSMAGGARRTRMGLAAAAGYGSCLRPGHRGTGHPLQVPHPGHRRALAGQGRPVGLSAPRPHRPRPPSSMPRSQRVVRPGGLMGTREPPRPHAEPMSIYQIPRVVGPGLGLSANWRTSSSRTWM